MYSREPEHTHHPLHAVSYPLEKLETWDCPGFSTLQTPKSCAKCNRTTAYMLSRAQGQRQRNCHVWGYLPIDCYLQCLVDYLPLLRRANTSAFQCPPHRDLGDDSHRRRGVLLEQDVVGLEVAVAAWHCRLHQGFRYCQQCGRSGTAC